METLSKEFKKIFLLELTKQLIMHSQKREIEKLEGIIELEQKEMPYIIEKITPITPLPIIRIPEIKKTLSLQPQIAITKLAQKPSAKPMPAPVPRRLPLVIPEPKLPAHLEYLKPVPGSPVEIDLLKLNPLIKDTAVKMIEISPDEQVIVRGNMGTKPTSIILNKEDINRTIDKFSEASKIPVSEGIYKVVIGNLILTAIISEVIGSRLIIKKIIAPLIIPQQNAPPFIPRIK